jgi:hypothetical protein
VPGSGSCQTINFVNLGKVGYGLLIGEKAYETILTLTFTTNTLLG